MQFRTPTKQARLAKLVPEQFYHVFNRTNNRETLFFDYQDHYFFMRQYKRFVAPFVHTYAYCLIPNHFHFALSIKSAKELIRLSVQTPEELRTSPQKKLLAVLAIAYAEKTAGNPVEGLVSIVVLQNGELGGVDALEEGLVQGAFSGAAGGDVVGSEIVRDLSAPESEVAGLLHGLAAPESEVAGLLHGLAAPESEVAGLLHGFAAPESEVAGLLHGLAAPESEVVGLLHGLVPPESEVAGLSHGLVPPESGVAGLLHGLVPPESGVAGLLNGLAAPESGGASLSHGLVPPESEVAGLLHGLVPPESGVAGLSHGLVPPESGVVGLLNGLAAPESGGGLVPPESDAAALLKDLDAGLHAAMSKALPQDAFNVYSVSSDASANNTFLVAFLSDEVEILPEILASIDLNLFHNVVERQFTRLFTVYAMYFNKKYQRSGNLFYRPFKRLLIQDERYLRYLIFYIHLNPRNHGVSPDFSSFQWSSFIALCSDRLTLLNRTFVWELFGGLEGFLAFHQVDGDPGLDVDMED